MVPGTWYYVIVDYVDVGGLDCRQAASPAAAAVPHVSPLAIGDVGVYYARVPLHRRWPMAIHEALLLLVVMPLACNQVHQHLRSLQQGASAHCARAQGRTEQNLNKADRDAHDFRCTLTTCKGQEPGRRMHA